MAEGPRVRQGRAVQVLAWALNSPRRAVIAAGAIALVGLLLLVMAIGAVTGRGGAPAATDGKVDRSSCRSVTTGFAQAFFATAHDDGWAGRVTPWVDPSLVDTVGDIDPDEVPNGVPSLQRSDEEGAACDAWFVLGPTGSRIHVEASTPAGDGVWYVTAWGPAEGNGQSESVGTGR